MTVKDIWIDTDEDGFHLQLEVEERPRVLYDFKLPQELAVKLLRESDVKIGDWLAEGGRR